MKVVFEFSTGERVEVDAYTQLNVLAHAQLAERSLQSRCGGHCECSTCRVVLREGELSAMRAPERELLERAGVADPAMRLACQCFPERGAKQSDGSEAVVLGVPAEKFIDARGKRPR